MFLLLNSSFLSLYNNTFIIHLPWYIILLINEKSFLAFRIILHRAGKNIPCYECSSYAPYHLHSAYEI
jgi:hypothetical protein